MPSDSLSGTAGRTTGFVRTLGRLTDETAGLRGVRRADVRRGDWLLVETRNSRYSILALGDGRFCVTGGWFDHHAMSPATVTISGCTFGGSAIQTDFIAGPGLCLEFGNRVVTTRIRGVRLIRADDRTSWN
jgi:hypothetical protein